MNLMKTLTTILLFTLIVLNAKSQKIAAYVGTDMAKIIKKEGERYSKKIDKEGNKYIEYNNLYGNYPTRFYYKNAHGKCKHAIVFYPNNKFDVIYKTLMENDNAIKKDSKTFYSINHNAYLYFFNKSKHSNTFTILVTKEKFK